MTSKTQSIVVQSNKLVESHYRQEYNVQEQRTILWVISEIHRNDYIFHENNALKEMTIPAADYAKLMGTHVDNVYRDASKIGESLMEKVLKIEEDGKWLLIHWVSSMRYDDGVITIKIHPDLIPYLIDLKEKFTSFKLENILYLGSSYAIKIYQLLAQYKSIGARELKVNDLRSMLGVSEVKTYQSYGQFKHKIIELSKREINTKTDLNISYSEVKKNRKVVAVKFRITEKPAQEQQAKEGFKAFVQQGKDEILSDLLKNCTSDNDFFKQNLVISAFERFLQEKIQNYEPSSSKPLQFIKVDAVI